MYLINQSSSCNPFLLPSMATLLKACLMMPYSACEKIRIHVVLTAMKAYIWVQLRAHAKNVSPRTILMCWILGKMNLCADIVALWILNLYYVNGTHDHSKIFWVAVVCAAKPFLTTILIILAKRCGALTVKVISHIHFHVVHKLVECGIAHSINVFAKLFKFQVGFLFFNCCGFASS